MTNCLSVFDHFVGLALKGLSCFFFRLLELKLLIEAQVKSEEQHVILHNLCQLETDEIEMKIMQARGWLMLGKVEKSVEVIH